MALSDYAAFFGWAGAAVGVHSGTVAAVRRGWIRFGGRSHVALMALTGMLVLRTGLVMARWSRDAEAAAGAVVMYEAFYWLAVLAACIGGLALGVCVEAVSRRRRGKSLVPPRVPGRRGHLVRRPNV